MPKNASRISKFKSLASRIRSKKRRCLKSTRDCPFTKAAMAIQCPPELAAECPLTYWEITVEDAHNRYDTHCTRDLSVVVEIYILIRYTLICSGRCVKPRPWIPKKIWAPNFYYGPPIYLAPCSGL